MAKEPGYVYILTNPSFREDWVKIGKSSRPVNVRSKELDNTAVPLPFEIYATLKTIKYGEVEKLVHKTIDRLTDLRIRQNREFFNVRPDIALDILKDIASTLDDAEIETFVNGNLIHIGKNSDQKDLDQSTAIRSLKNKFWKGYIEAMRSNDLFNKNFTLHESLPRHSYDLRLGTSACNIYQAITRKALKIGIYFHGKQLFNEFSKWYDDINNIIGNNTEWTEFEKDCAISITRDFEIDQTDSYNEAYTWFLNNSINLKNAYNGFFDLKNNVANGSAKAVSSDEYENGNSENKKQRPRFKFSMVGIPIGSELTFVPTGIKVKVASDDQIEYEGRIYKLSPFVGTFMPTERHNTSGAYQGAKFFTYKGEILDDIRSRMEKTAVE